MGEQQDQPMAAQLRDRTQLFAIRVLDVVDALPGKLSARRVAAQLADAGTSVGANYRAVCRARSPKEFIAKMCIVHEEADETHFWLEVIVAKKWIKERKLKSLMDEALALTKIANRSIVTARRNLAATKASKLRSPENH